MAVAPFAGGVNVPLRFRRQPRRLVETPTLLQAEALECGAVALAIVLAHHGRWVPIEDLRAACGVSRNGSTAGNMLRAARAHGLEARALRLEPGALHRLEPPLVLHWNFSHFVVFEGFPDQDHARINDPATGRLTVPVSELDQCMTGVVLAFSPGPSFARRGERPQVLRSLRHWLVGTRGALAHVFLVSLLLAVPGVAMPALSQMFVDQVLVGRDTTPVGPLLLAMSAAMVLLGLLSWRQRSFLLRFETRLAVERAGHFFWHLLRLPMSFHGQRYAADLAGRVALNDRLAELVSRDLALSAFDVVLVVCFACVMMQYDPLLTGLGILVVAVNVAALRRVARKRADGNRRLLREQGRLTTISTWGLEMIEGLKATGSEGDLFAHWAGQQARVVNLQQELEVANQPPERIAPFLTALHAALILGLGGLRVIEGQLSLGGLLAFQILTAGFMAPVSRLVGLGRRLQLAEGEMGMLDDVLRARPVGQDESRPAPAARATFPARLSGRLELRGVGFAYGPLDAPVVADVDLVIEPGACVAVVGRTGSGKSTLARLVSGLHEPSRGQILFDGHARSGLPPGLWSRSVAVVDQDIFAFEGTVRENLTVWDGTLAMDRLRAAVRDAGIGAEIEGRPGGFEASVEEGGSNWSGGQLQRLELARALAGDPSLLVLDEATSALDSETEARIVESLRRRGCSCLVIAHRLSTIRHADEILVLDGGRVVQRGRHEELAGASGPYAELVQE
jgi:NHLM bacteriocin system ABC transporter peptidase/ATP-binding protein